MYKAYALVSLVFEILYYVIIYIIMGLTYSTYSKCKWLYLDIDKGM